MTMVLVLDVSVNDNGLGPWCLLKCVVIAIHYYTPHTVVSYYISYFLSYRYNLSEICTIKINIINRFFYLNIEINPINIIEYCFRILTLKNFTKAFVSSSEQIHRTVSIFLNFLKNNRWESWILLALVVINTTQNVLKHFLFSYQPFHNYLYWLRLYSLIIT